MRSIAGFADGSFAVAGWFRGTQAFGGEGVTAEGGFDLYVAHYREDGTLDRFLTDGGAGDDRAWSLAPAPQRCLMLVGQLGELLVARHDAR